MKAIVTDLDNTLLHSDKSLTGYTVGVLEKCRGVGITVIFATARSAMAASAYTSKFRPDVFIGYGGALVTAAKGEIIRRFEMNTQISQTLIEELLRTPQVYTIYAINENTALYNSKEPIIDTDYSHYRLHDFREKTKEGFLKISVDSTDKSVLDKLAERYPMCDLLHYSGEPLSRFANKEAVKWNAVKAASEYLSLSTDDFIAFGDDSNDLEMIKNCGTGIAVSNAIEEVKAAADDICGANNSDGVAKWIEANLLQNA